MCAIFLLDWTDSAEAREIYGDIAAKAGKNTADACFGTDIYPKKPAAVLGGKHKAAVMRWGFSLDRTSKVVFNARSENLAERRMFRPILKNRCLVPATAFYDFTKEHKRFKVRVPSQPLFYLAALWRAETDKNGGKEFHFTVITTEACPQIAAFHDRMPVVLPTQTAFSWLDERADIRSLILPANEPLAIAASE